MPSVDVAMGPTPDVAVALTGTMAYESEIHSAVLAEMVAELKRVLQGKRDVDTSTPTEGTPSKQQPKASEMTVARNLIIDIGAGELDESETSETTYDEMTTRVEAAERAQAEADERAAAAWERLAELEKASTKKAVTGETAVLVKQNESLAQTNKELMARLKVLERSQYHSSIRLAKLESDLRESESVRDDLESKILNAERVCTALANVAVSKEKTAIETTVEANRLRRLSNEYQESKSSLTVRVADLEEAKADLEVELAAVQANNRKLQTKLETLVQADELGLRAAVAELEQKLKSANESLALSTLESYRRRQLLVSTACQTMPQAAVAKVQNTPYLEKPFHLEATTHAAWVQDLKMWYMTNQSLAPHSRKTIKTCKLEEQLDGMVRVDRSIHDLGLKILSFLVKELRANKVFTFDDVVSPSVRRLKSKAKEAPKEPVLKELRAEVENLQEKGREWLNKVAADTKAAAAAAKAAMPSTPPRILASLAPAAAAPAAAPPAAPAVTSPAAPPADSNTNNTDAATSTNTRANTRTTSTLAPVGVAVPTLVAKDSSMDLGTRLGQWWSKVSRPAAPTEAEIAALTDRVAAATVALAVQQAMGFLTTKSKTVSFLTHEEATALATIRTRAAADAALKKLRSTLGSVKVAPPQRG
eukprot:m.108448 g.108448  ORF g.108448 m.108448 type:complete len:650 (+) comp10659_c0_seq3:119-2068(+)